MSPHKTSATVDKRFNAVTRFTIPKAAERQALRKAAASQGLMGRKDRQLGGCLPSDLVEAAQHASGITELTELLIYALTKVALEDHYGEEPEENYGEKILTLAGTVPKGAFSFED